MVPRPRFERLDADTRSRILEAAIDEFGAKGFEAASLNRIIERSQISKGAMYYYFDDKADLHATATLHAIWSFQRGVAWPELNRMTAASFWSDLTDVYLATVDFGIEHPAIMNLMKTLARESDGKFPESLTQVMSQALIQMEHVLLRGQALGAVRTDLPNDLLVAAVMAVGETVDRWLLSRWDEMSAEEIEQQVPKLLGLLHRIAAPDPDSAGG